MSLITIPDLIRNFDNQLRQNDQRFIENVGKVPQYPMLLVFLGEEAIASYGRISSQLFQLWPQYRDELRFFGIPSAKATEYCFLATGAGGETLRQPLPREKVNEAVSGLFSRQYHFADRSRLLVYYVIDSTAMTGKADLADWLAQIDSFKGVMGFGSMVILNMMTLLLNETDDRHLHAAGEIRNLLGERIDIDLIPTLVLSSRGSDNAILTDWQECYQIITDVIALTNNCDSQFSQLLFSQGVYTVSYVREEKPAEEISKVVVKELIDHLARENFGSSGNLLADRSLPARLGFTEEFTLRILDNYAAQVLYRELPDAARLNLFPRNSDYWYDDVSVLTDDEFDQLTMHSWRAYLGEIVERVRIQAEKDPALYRKLSQDYARQIASSFSIPQIIWLKEHLDEIRPLFGMARAPSGLMPVLSCARARINYILASNRDLMNIFLNVIEEMGAQAKAFLDAWNNLSNSRTTIHAVKDSDLEVFYRRLLTVEYFDRNGRVMSESFKRVTDTASLRDFLNKALKHIFDSCAIFSASFEDELEARFSRETTGFNAKQQIVQQLTGSNAPIFFQSSFNYGSTAAFAVMLKMSSPLCKDLQRTLSSDTYYYDTGNGSMADSLKVYRMTANNLING